MYKNCITLSLKTDTQRRYKPSTKIWRRKKKIEIQKEKKERTCDKFTWNETTRIMYNYMLFKIWLKTNRDESTSNRTIAEAKASFARRCERNKSVVDPVIYVPGLVKSAKPRITDSLIEKFVAQKNYLRLEQNYLNSSFFFLLSLFFSSSSYKKNATSGVRNE